MATDSTGETALIRTLPGHEFGVTAVAVTPDGQQVVSVSWDNTRKVWDLTSDRELRILSDHGGLVTAVAVTQNGQWVVSASGDNTLKVWDLASGRASHPLRSRRCCDGGCGDPGRAAAVSASWDKNLKVWDLASGHDLRTISGHTDAVRAVAVTPDGQWAVSASADKTLKVWDLAS